MAPQPDHPHPTGKRLSRYLGVTWHSQRRLWQASIKVKSRILYLGFFPDERAAARAYDQAARQYKGHGAPTNFPKAT